VMMPQLIRHGMWSYWKERRRIRHDAWELLERVGLGHRLAHLPSELSGGEMQRAAIARALAGRPSVLLADEPTGNLDPTTSMEIMNVLDKINQNNTTVVMATHDDDIVNGMRKRVIELRNGVVLRDEAKALYTSMIPVVDGSDSGNGFRNAAVRGTEADK
jgi:cell division transport system ATP-binding protein